MGGTLILRAHRLMPCPRSTHGPLIHDRAVEKVARHVNDAVEKGAQILIGGRRIDSPGTFFAPTVLSDVPPSALVNHEETFGPIAALRKFETEEEVIKLANDTEVGLAGYFYSRDVGRVWRVAEALRRVALVSPPKQPKVLVLKYLRSRGWPRN